MRRLGSVPASPRDGSEPDHPVLPEPPAWAGGDAAAVWQQLAPLVPPGKLTPRTAHSFALLCIALATYTEAHRIVLDSGLLLAEGSELTTSPGYPIRTTQNAIALHLLKTFGLTPDQPPSARPGRRPLPHLVQN